VSDDSCWFTVAAGNGRAAESESVAMSSHEKQEGARYRCKTCAIQNAYHFTGPVYNTSEVIITRFVY
jgi:hypothetical protein